MPRHTDGLYHETVTWQIGRCNYTDEKRKDKEYKKKQTIKTIWKDQTIWRDKMDKRAIMHLKK